jgi:hypothetical protein
MSAKRQTPLQRQVERTVKAARRAVDQTERLIQRMDKVNLDDALSLGDIYRAQVAAQMDLENRLEGMALWSSEIKT